MYSLEDRFCDTDDSDTSSASASDFDVKFDTTIDTSITRIASRRGITVFLTPLVLPASEVLLKHLRTDVRDSNNSHECILLNDIL